MGTKAIILAYKHWGCPEYQSGTGEGRVAADFADDHTTTSIYPLIVRVLRYEIQRLSNYCGFRG